MHDVAHVELSDGAPQPQDAADQPGDGAADPVDAAPVGETAEWGSGLRSGPSGASYDMPDELARLRRALAAAGFDPGTPMARRATRTRRGGEEFAIRINHPGRRGGDPARLLREASILARLPPEARALPPGAWPGACSARPVFEMLCGVGLHTWPRPRRELV